MEAAFISQSNSMIHSLGTGNSIECSEETLVAAAKSGSSFAFELLVERYQRRLFRVARSLAQSREDAEEITQDAFAQAFKNLSQFRGDSRFYTWLVRITINAGRMKLRGRRVNLVSIDDHAESEEGIVPRELEDGRPSPERCYLRQELREILTRSIGQLTPGHRRVFELREVAGCSTKETAHALDLSPSAVKSRLRRARNQLRQSLSQDSKVVKEHSGISVGLASLLPF